MLAFNEASEMTWNKYRIVLQQMTWKQHLACSDAFLTWAETQAAKQDMLARQISIVTLLLLYSRISVYRDGKALPDGTHDLGNGAAITLPVTEDCLNNLPVEMATFLIKAAQAKNMHTLQQFYEGMSKMQLTAGSA